MANARKKYSISDRFFLIMKGIAMGAANKVPGVSGGIVALVGGFYEELIFSLQHFNLKALKFLVTGQYIRFWKYTNGSFLLTLFSGIIISFFSVSLILDYGLAFYKAEVLGLFMGMIMTSIYYIREDIKEWDFSSILSLFFGAAVGLLITFIQPAGENDNYFFVFFCGLISVSGMTLPGLSGSFLLLVLGNYNLLLVETITNLYQTIIQTFQGDFSFLQNRQQIRLLTIMGIFTSGSLAGLIFFANLLSFVIKKYHKITIATIIGFIIGTIRIVWPWRIELYEKNEVGDIIYNKIGNAIVVNQKFYFPKPENDPIITVLIAILLGSFIIIGLEYYGKKQPK